MREHMRVLIVDQNQDARFELKRIAARAGIEVVGEVGLGTEAVSTAAELKPDAVLCGMSQPMERAMQTMESMVDALPETPIIAYGWEQNLDAVRRAMLAGARDFILMPADAVRLAESLRIVMEAQAKRRERASGEAPTRDPRGFVVAVFAAKGGVGKTTVSTNVAVALASAHSQSVVLLDMDDSFGDVASMLDLPTEPNLVDYIRDADRLSRDDIPSRLVSHSTGLYVLPTQRDPLKWRSISPPDIQKVIGSVARRFDVVIVDTGAMLTEVTLTVLKESDLVLWITSSDYSSINNSVLGLDALGQLQYPRERIRIVLNSVMPDGGSVSKMEAALAAPFWWHIPNDPKLRAGSQAGQPGVLSDAPGPGADSLRRLASTLMGETPAAPEKKSSPLRKLMPWRSRTDTPRFGSEARNAETS
jgi:pilus assembly protein CpaE